MQRWCNARGLALLSSAIATMRTCSSGRASADANDDVSWDIEEGDPHEPVQAVATDASASPLQLVRQRAGFVATADAEDMDPLWARCPPSELVNRTAQYLHTARTEALADEAYEQLMFGALILRVDTVPVANLLDILELRWPREVAVRHMESLSDAVKRRILGALAQFDATHERARGWAHADDGPEEVLVNEGAAELTPLAVARCIVVMGLKGRRRRDLELFKALGKSLALCVNEIKDPHTLCYVLVAFQHARIRPPDEFLGLVGRRLPVLNKNHTLEPLPAFRALCFFDRSDYPLMNPYRFLADRVMAHVKDGLRREGKGQGFTEPKVITPRGYDRRTLADADAADDGLDDSDFEILARMKGGQSVEESSSPIGAPTNSDADAKSGSEGVGVAENSEPATVVATENSLLRRAIPAYVANASQSHDPDERAEFVALQGESPERAERRRIRERFARLTCLTPPQLTKMLLILARRHAPRQQYLRPLVSDLLVEATPHFNPPSFSRLVRAMRSFQSEETALIAMVIDTLHERGPARLVLGDLMDVLFLLSRPSTPLVCADKLFDLCRRTFEDGSRLRPRDMLMITGDLLMIRRLKFDEEGADTPAFHSLVGVVDGFAQRMASFLELGLLEPAHADALLDMCAQLQPGREPSDGVARLLDAKQAAFAEGESAYHELVGANVREVFMRIQAINATMTHRGYRPVAATAMQEFKALLDFMRADDILEAVHLYEQAYPRSLSIPVRRVVGRFVVDKLALELKVLRGELPAPPPPAAPELVPLGSDHAGRPLDGHRRVYAPYDVTSPKYSPLLFRPQSLAKFANIVLATPLVRVQRSTDVWQFLSLKAKQFQSDELSEIVEERLSSLAAERDAVALAQIRGSAASLASTAVEV